jgi:hypothetical protein
LLESKYKCSVEELSRLDNWLKKISNNVKVIKEESRHNCVFLRNKESTVVILVNIIKRILYIEKLKNSVAVEYKI